MNSGYFAQKSADRVMETQLAFPVPVKTDNIFKKLGSRSTRSGKNKIVVKKS